jgi:putative peptidoglycan lipid II flippase
LAIFRVVVILRQFGLSNALDIDAFNAANNIPDMLFVLISGGALAMAFIPVLTEVMTKDGRKSTWKLFSQIANIAFLVTLGFAVLIAIFAEPLVKYVIAPGFTPERMKLMVELMRLNLVATIIFSISGLVIAGLQSNQHFLLPALAPIFYNIGQLIGVSILAPKVGLHIGGLTLPAFGLGERGMVYGVILGAILHLGIQIPGLIKYQFKWSPMINLRDARVQQVLKVLGPRILTMFFIQLTFVIKDNLASRLTAGAISALTYGWMIMQVPETLIGTAIGTALLPTLSENIVLEERDLYKQTIQRAFRILLALTIPIAVIFSFGLGPILSTVFRLDTSSSNLLLWVTQGYMIGLAGQCLLEVASRSFYSQQDAKTPLWSAILNAAIFAGLGYVLIKPLGAPGISLADSIAFTVQALILIAILNIRFINFPQKFKDALTNLKQAIITGNEARGTLLRAAIAALLATGAMLLVEKFVTLRLPDLVSGILLMVAGMSISLPFIWKELRLLLHL